MIKILITIFAILAFFTKSSFAQGYNYYDSPNPYISSPTALSDSYQFNQYGGPMKNKGKIEASKYYFEAGIRANQVGQTTLDQDGENKVESTSYSLKSSDMEPDNGYGISVKVGYDDINHNRYDFEISYEQNSFGEWNFKDISNIKYKDSKISVMSFNLNYYRDFLEKTIVSPYLGIGLGMSNASFDTGKGVKDGVANANVVGKGSDQAINYQLMAGGRIKINENNKINLGYHYRSTFTDLEFQTKTVATNEKSNSLTMGYNAHIFEISYQHLFSK